MGPAASSPLSRVGPYSGAGREGNHCRVRGSHPLRRPIPEPSASDYLGNSQWPVLQHRPDESGWFGLVRVRSPLLTESRLLSVPPGTEMFQFPGLAAPRLWIQRGLIRAPRDQCSFDSSPGLIAVFHALRRRLAPRHPPHALSSLAALIAPPAGHGTPDRGSDRPRLPGPAAGLQTPAGRE
jgi:hypothetical protein